jgi:hypothetical protein
MAKDEATESKIQKLERDRDSVKEVLARIDEAIANIERDAKASGNPDDAEFVDRFTAEGGRKGIMQEELAKIEQQLAELR